MVFKILGMERAWELHNQDMKKPRQVFVTKSRVLAEKVSEYFSKLSESLSAAGRSPKELVELAKSRQSQQQEGGLVDLDDEPDWRQDLPSRFSLLEEKHFPLFITFDRVTLFLLFFVTIAYYTISYASYWRLTSRVLI
jgi:hypothetical protein